MGCGVTALHCERSGLSNSRSGSTNLTRRVTFFGTRAGIWQLDMLTEIYEAQGRGRVGVRMDATYCRSWVGGGGFDSLPDLVVSLPTWYSIG